MSELEATVKARPAGTLVVLNFWADWAEPCKQMNDVADELAKEHPNALFVQVRDAARSEAPSVAA